MVGSRAVSPPHAHRPRSPRTQASQLAARLDALLGSSRWLLVFGGDFPSDTRPNLGNVVREVATKHRAPVLAVQKSLYRASGGVGRFCNFVHYYPAGESDPFGGTDGDRPVGATATYLGPVFLPHLAGATRPPRTPWRFVSRAGLRRGRSLSIFLCRASWPPNRFPALSHTGVFAFGGGEISLQEAQFAVRCGLPFKYFPFRVIDHADTLGPFGRIHDWASSLRGPKPSTGVPRVVRETARPSLTPTEHGACLTMHQPWASLVVFGLKRLEGRGWHSEFRGRLWIHAAAKEVTADEIAEWEGFYRTLYAHLAPAEVRGVESAAA